LFLGNYFGSEVRLLAALRDGHRVGKILRLARVLTSAICILTEPRVPFRDEYSHLSALKLSQSALRPKISNLACQRFLLSAKLPCSTVALLLDSMGGRNGWPRVYRDLCPPIRMCTSWLAGCPSGHPTDHSIVHRSLRTLKTVSGDTMDTRREPRAQIFFPRHARLSSRFPLIGGTTNAKANAQRIIERRTPHHTENTLPID